MTVHVTNAMSHISYYNILEITKRMLAAILLDTVAVVIVVVNIYICISLDSCLVKECFKIVSFVLSLC